MFQILKWFILSLILMFVAWILPGIKINNLAAAFAATFLISFINIFIKPILVILTIPINLITMGLFMFVINALLFAFVASVVPGFEVEGFLPALLGSMIFSLMSMFVNI